MGKNDYIEVKHENQNRAKGFTMVDNIVLDDNEISVQARFLYAQLLKYAFNKEKCFPKQKDLAEICNSSVRTIQNWLKELVDYGLIETKERRDSKTKRRMTNLYIIKDVNKVYKLSTGHTKSVSHGGESHTKSVSGAPRNEFRDTHTKSVSGRKEYELINNKNKRRKDTPPSNKPKPSSDVDKMEKRGWI